MRAYHTGDDQRDLRQYESFFSQKIDRCEHERNH